MVKANLKPFSQQLKEIQGVLEALKEDELADFNAEDSRQMEKEDERFRKGRKLKLRDSVA